MAPPGPLLRYIKLRFSLGWDGLVQFSVRQSLGGLLLPHGNSRGKTVAEFRISLSSMGNEGSHRKGSRRKGSRSPGENKRRLERLKRNLESFNQRLTEYTKKLDRHFEILAVPVLLTVAEEVVQYACNNRDFGDNFLRSHRCDRFCGVSQNFRDLQMRVADCMQLYEDYPRLKLKMEDQYLVFQRWKTFEATIAERNSRE